MKKYYFYMLAGAMTITAACNSDLNSYEVKVKPVESITIREQPFTLMGGVDSQLFVSIAPTDASRQQIVWRSADPATVMVSDVGKVTATGVGSTTIYAVSVNSATAGSDNLSAEVRISVYDTIVGISLQDAQVYKGCKLEMRDYVTITPARTTNKHVTWAPRAGAATYFSVDAHGLLTATQNVGKAKIDVYTDAIASKGHTTKMDSATVEVIIPFNELPNKKDWTVVSVAIDNNGENYGYAWDGGSKDAHASGNPQHMFDDNTKTFLSFIKHGGSTINSIISGADAPYFVVDMKESQTFSGIKWAHRTGKLEGLPEVDFNGNPTGGPPNPSTNGGDNSFLRVFGIILEGSNDSVEFTIIPPVDAQNEDNIIWIPNMGNYTTNSTTSEANPYIIPVPQSTYRYLRVTCKVHNKNYGEGEGKYQHPDYPGTGASPTQGNSMQIGEFAVGNEFVPPCMEQ